MSTTKSSKKHVPAHARSTSPDTSVIHATSPASPEVSTPAATPVTSVTSLPALAAALPMTPPGDLPPAIGVPEPRAGWEPSPKRGRARTGLRPKAAQAANAAAVAKEITESTTYVADFGSRAPAAAQVAFVVTNAAKWRETWQAARRFFVYASEQRAAWENTALAQMDALKPAFSYATTRDATVEEKYAATAQYLGATNAIAARAATSRKAKAKEKKGATAPAPAVAPVAPETPAVTAPTAPTAKG